MPYAYIFELELECCELGNCYIYHVFCLWNGWMDGLFDCCGMDGWMDYLIAVEWMDYLIAIELLWNGLFDCC